jgi:probable HAF family extracellular repeat protein
MRREKLSWIAGTALVAMLAAPFTNLAQEQPQLAKKHARYTPIDLGTLGGYATFVNAVTRRGTAVGGGLTSVPDPICTGPWNQNPDNCLYEHAFNWRDGVLTDLGTLPGGNNSVAVSMNENGAIFGVSENGLQDPIYGVRAFVATIWKRGEIENLGTLGGTLSWPGLSINDHGLAVGSAATPDPDPDGFATALVFDPSAILPGVHWHAALWQNGSIRDLGTLADGLDSVAIFVNDRGQVAGMSYTNSIPNPEFGIPTVDPFFWENGQMIDVGTLGGTRGTLGPSGALGGVGGLNNKGQIAGTSNLAGDLTQHAFLWERGRPILDLGTLGGDFSFAGWIDDSGEVVGGSTTTTDPQTTLRAFRWKNGQMANLGSLYGDACSLAFGSNSKGQIVGNSIPCDGGGPSRPFLWEDGGPMVDLNTLIPGDSGIHLNEAEIVNEKGEILASATFENGEVHSYLLIPDGHDVIVDVTEATADASQRSGSRSLTHARLTPEKLAQLRSLSANRYRFGLHQPKNAQ